MKKIRLTLLFLFILNSLSAQTEVNSIQLGIGKSWHGTGDLKGIVLDAVYEHNFKRRLSFSNGLTTTIHYGKDKGFNFLNPGTSPDERLMRFTTAGLQLNSVLYYAFLKRPDYKLRLGGGAILRFQSTSYPEIYGFQQDQRYYPEPFYVIYNHGSQNTLSAGYMVSLNYMTQIAMKYQLGIKAAFQNDSNSDAITHISLIIGRQLPSLK